MSWISITAAAGSQAERDLIAALLIAAGASAVQERGQTIITYLTTDLNLAALTARISREVGNVDLCVEHVGEIAVDMSWTANVGVQRVGRLTVAPPWLVEADEDRSRLIVIDPATAFGTGDHPSTRLMLLLMQEVVRTGDRVADLGAGSGVLSIAAVRLGAAWVAAIEIDPGSIGNAEENVRRNGVSDRVKLIEGDAMVLLPLVAPVRVILANILPGVIQELGPVMGHALTADGRAVIGGVLIAERDSLVALLGAEGWRVVRENAEGEWWGAEIARG